MLNCRRISSVALIVTLGILLGRALGLLRELALATSCGLTREADLATVAVLWPDLLNAIFMGGGVSAVLIPEFHRLWAAEGVAAANQMACQFLVLIGLAATLIASLIA